MNTSIVEDEVAESIDSSCQQKIQKPISWFKAIAAFCFGLGEVTAWKAGYRASADYAAVNPHPRGSQHHSEWELGRDAASEDAESIT